MIYEFNVGDVVHILDFNSSDMFHKNRIGVITRINLSLYWAYDVCTDNGRIVPCARYELEKVRVIDND